MRPAHARSRYRQRGAGPCGAGLTGPCLPARSQVAHSESQTPHGAERRGAVSHGHDVDVAGGDDAEGRVAREHLKRQHLRANEAVSAADTDGLDTHGLDTCVRRHVRD